MISRMPTYLVISGSVLELTRIGGVADEARTNGDDLMMIGGCERRQTITELHSAERAESTPPNCLI